MNQLSLTIGNTTVTVPIKLTNAQALAVIMRYALVKGIQTEGRTAAEIGTAALKAMMRDVRNTSIDRQRFELEEAERAAREATLANDNDLFDDPPQEATP